MRKVLAPMLLAAGVLMLACAPAQPAAQPAPAAPAAPAPAAQPAKPAVQPAAPAAAAKKQLVPGFEVDEALLEAAKKEGKVVYWGSLREQEVKAIADRFQEVTGVKVETTRLSAGPMFTRLTKEREAKLYTVDVIQHGDLGLWQTHKQKKNVVAYSTEGSKKYTPSFRDKDGLFAATFLLAMPIGYNPKIIAGADVPKRLADLTDPKYKGKVATAHAKHSGTGNEFVIMVTEKLGWEYYEKLKRNDLFLVRSQFELNPIAIGGERPIALGPVESSFLDDKNAGKPLDVVYPEEGTPVTWVPSGVVADAPHPNAAKLFQEWLHSQAGQTVIASWFYMVPHPDASYPAGRKKLTEISTMALPLEEIEKKSVPSRDRFSDLFGG
ncbi:MAG: extracellular solute-binding protein [Chloroflexi bacterium]|nr:extracellular solute-binding protein [Chloroflexota bacterium]MBI4505134.1 extracellular solute-binding protein [Chloroflexota bacterium]